MKRVILELDDNYADVISITAIGVKSGTNITSVVYDIREKDYITLQLIDGKAHWEQK